MLTHNLGYPRLGINRDLKRLIESYWNQETGKRKLRESASALRILHWTRQKEAGIDLIPSNDFSLYDQVLDMCLLTGAIPERYEKLFLKENDKINSYPVDAYFAMARGLQDEEHDIQAMEMTKWFNTNYHYIVPEFTPGQTFQCLSSKIFDEYEEAKSVGIVTKPVLIGPVSFLLLGKVKKAPETFHRLELLDSLLPVYEEILWRLNDLGVEWLQIDEPFLSLDLDESARSAYQKAYSRLTEGKGDLKLLLATYFEGIGHNIDCIRGLAIDGLHLDLTADSEQLETVIEGISEETSLSVGLIDGRNIWKTDLEKASSVVKEVCDSIGKHRVMLAPSCSLLHCPVDLEQETDETTLPREIKRWMAFANQKLEELTLLKNIVSAPASETSQKQLERHQADIADKGSSPFVHNPEVRLRLHQVNDSMLKRDNSYPERSVKQRKQLNVPDLFPTTTIGSFPQTREVRKWRADYRNGKLSGEEYKNRIQKTIKQTIDLQEDVGLDLLVHGEFERNDMVEYFGEHLAGFAFTRNGWVQSYGTRGVKPPIIYGDVSRPGPITVEWSTYARSLTDKPVKGMLTGPVTILQWSFVRDDQPRSETAKQIALAIRDEVCDLEQSGIQAIQIDEPAFREGLPLRREDWDEYLKWAVEAFRMASAGVDDQTQIHTHMCYSEFNDIIEHIARLDADVISIETSRSQMELLDAFVAFDYPNEIGPGVYDIHSPRVPDVAEMAELLEKASDVLKPEQIWVNPDCGLKTRGWEETRRALTNMVKAAHIMRENMSTTIPGS